MASLNELLEASAARHSHLCPRQVLGVRMGLLAGEVLGIPIPQADKRLLAIMETNGCASDGVAVATNCWVGRRTLWVEDYGKVAATFVDTLSGQAIRIAPRTGIRDQVLRYAPDCVSRWETQLLGYQRMPACELLTFQAVQLKTPLAWLVSQPGLKVICDGCGEEIMNEREVISGDQTLCRACAGLGYYSAFEPASLQEPDLQCLSLI